VTRAFNALEDGETVLEDKAESLWRQVHPKFFQDGEVSSLAFRPFPRDNGMLSVRREAFGADRSYHDHVRLGLDSAGTWTVSVGEVLEVGARAVDDSALPDRPEAHAYVDYRHLSRRQTEAAAKRLRAAATQHGRVYP
jgi:hypothetical protein